MHWNQSWIAVSAACLVAICLGCRGGENGGSNRSDGTSTQQAGDTDAPAKNPDNLQPTEPVQPPKPTIPQVKLSDKDAATCLVNVDDPMPEGTLSDLEGKEHQLRSLFGERLTVVCFWKADHMYALEELQQLGTDVVQPYGEKGVSIVGINQTDPPKVVREKIELTGAKFLNLLDPDGAYFRKVATEKLPRTYLLDAEGKIIWFDIEYSRSTRRDLLQAIQVALGEK